MAHWQWERGKKRCERDCAGTDEGGRCRDIQQRSAYAFRNGLTTGTPPSQQSRHVIYAEVDKFLKSQTLILAVLGL